MAALGEAFAASGRDPRKCRHYWRPKRAASASTRASCRGRSTSTCQAGSASATRWSSSACSRPRIAVLDEIDSGLDVDALRAVARGRRAGAEAGIGVLAITHYKRLLSELPVDRVHVLSAGRIVASGGPELALELEETGYVAYGEEP